MRSDKPIKLKKQKGAVLGFFNYVAWRVFVRGTMNLLIRIRNYFFQNSTFLFNDELWMASLLSPKIIDSALEFFHPASVLDLGCGTGKSLDYFLAKGIDAFGVEGSKTAIRKAHHPKLILPFNLNEALNLTRKFDMIWSFEFVEHIHPKYVDNLLKTFSNHSDTIVMSAAKPGQGGDGHFNEQPDEYWIWQFGKYGYVFNKQKTEILRTIDEPFAKNMMVFERSSAVKYPKQKIAVVHPHIVYGGGSELSAVWTVEALKQEYDVTFITMGQIDIGRINESFGTELKSYEFAAVSLTIPWLFKKRFDALRAYRLVRFCQHIAPKFDVMISTDNVMDFKKKGIQLIVDFTFYDPLRRTLDPVTVKRWYHQNTFFRKMYLKFGEWLSATSPERWKQNTTLVVSDWIGKLMHETFGVVTTTIYPPIVADFPDVPFENRKNAFLCIARISPEKEIDKVISILEKVRKGGNAISLHILGRVDDVQYAAYIKKLCEKNKEWCFLEGTLYGEKKLAFIANYKFAISGRTQEPGAFAVAEMVKAGCIVFVPNGGGQVEIANLPDLQYENEQDAVVKIERLLHNVNQQVAIRQRLAENIKKFSTEHFQRSIESVVADFLARQI